MTDMITLIATVPAILALVNLAKSFGVVGKWSALLAVVLGVGLQLADYAFLTDTQSASGWYGAAAAGLILGLSAAGLYDVARTVSPAAATIITARATDPGDVTTATDELPDTSAAEAYMDELDGINQPEHAAAEAH